MHIPDGFLDADVAVATGVTAAGVVGWSLRRADRTLDERRIPLLGVTGAFVFAAQMLNFPVAGGTSGHFLGAALAAVLLGPSLACLVLTVVLTMQAFLFADGGITALGANVLNMGVIGALAVGAAMLAGRRVLPRSRTAFLAVAGAGAWLAVMLGALATGIELALSGTAPAATVLPAMLGVHAVIGLGEAVITVAALGAVLATRPDLIAVGGPAPAAPGAVAARETAACPPAPAARLHRGGAGPGRRAGHRAGAVRLARARRTRSRRARRGLRARRAAASGAGGVARPRLRRAGGRGRARGEGPGRIRGHAGGVWRLPGPRRRATPPPGSGWPSSLATPSRPRASRAASTVLSTGSTRGPSSSPCSA